MVVADVAEPPNKRKKMNLGNEEHVIKKTEMKVEALASAVSASLVVTPPSPYHSVAFYSFDRIVCNGLSFQHGLRDQ